MGAICQHFDRICPGLSCKCSCDTCIVIGAKAVVKKAVKEDKKAAKQAKKKK